MMLDSFSQLFMGLGIALEPPNLAVALLGTILGTAVGVLPGLGPSATVSLLLPITMMLDQTSAIILLSGIYYGSQYGGSITSVLMRVPGEASSVMTCFDGYPMARQGRAGVALGISAFGSFIAGIAATLAIAIVGPAFTSVALVFGPVEKASIVMLGLVLAASIGDGLRVRAWAMVALGLLLSTVGVDLISGEERFAFGVSYLRDGFNIAVLAMGLFGVSEMLMLIERRVSEGPPRMPSYRLDRRSVLEKVRSKVSRDRKALIMPPHKRASYQCCAWASLPTPSSASSWGRCSCKTSCPGHRS